MFTISLAKTKVVDTRCSGNRKIISYYAVGSNNIKTHTIQSGCVIVLYNINL